MEGGVDAKVLEGEGEFTGNLKGPLFELQLI